MTTVIDLTDDKGTIRLKSGMPAIVPRGAWDRFDYLTGVTLRTITPGQSEYVRLESTIRARSSRNAIGGRSSHDHDP